MVARVVVLGVVLVGIGYFPARLVTGSRVWCLLIAPITAALLMGTIGTIGVLLRLPAAVTAIGAVVVSVATGVLVLWRSRRERGAAPGESFAPLLLPLAGVFPFLTVRRAPFEWDARSIWWFHARWFADGGTAVWRAMQNPAFAFSHPDYPPLASATNGALWWFGGTESLQQGQVVTAILTLSAVTVLALSVWYVARRRLSGWVVLAGAGVLVLATYGTVGVGRSAQALGTNGYVDMLWSAAFAAGCVFVLAAPREPAALRWGALCLAVAALTKNEGTAAVALVVGLALVRYRARRPAPVWLLGALLPSAAWLAVARLAGAPSEYLTDSKASQLMRLDRGVVDRFSPTIDAVWHEMSTIVLVAAGVSALGLLVATSARRRLSATAAPWMWLGWLTTTTAVVYAYVVSPAPLAWHLATSLDRTTIASKTLLLAECLLWTSAAVATLRWRAPGTAEPAATPRPPERTATVAELASR
jgi:hypothetical protein